MTIAWHITRRASLLGAAGFALLLVGCADQRPTAPLEKTVPTGPRATKLPDLTGEPDLKATVVTVQTWRDGSGKIHQKKFSQKVKASFKKGLARATIDDAAASDSPPAISASMTDDVAHFVQEYTTDETSLTPVIAVTSGSLAYNYADSQIDSVGNKFEIYGWAPSAGTPITDAWGYRNGILVSQYRAKWTPVSGGYMLAEQTLGSYLDDGTLVGTLVSTVTTGGGPQDQTPTNNESLGGRLGTFYRLALETAGCWLSPQTAYASVPCKSQGLLFGSETYGLYKATRSGAAFTSPGLYFAGWGEWTSSLHDFLNCVDANLPRGPRGSSVCNTNKKTVGCGAGGGGGTGWPATT